MPPATEPRWLDPVEMRAWRGHLRMSWLLAAAIERDLRRLGLSHPDYYVLVRLSESPDHRMRMTELAEGIQWSKSRLSHHIDRMERRGLVRREATTRPRPLREDALRRGVRACGWTGSSMASRNYYVVLGVASNETEGSASEIPCSTCCCTRPRSSAILITNSAIGQFFWGNFRADPYSPV